MRGLKPNLKGNSALYPIVASFTDAWIETKEMRHQYRSPKVASFTDAWIETPIWVLTKMMLLSHLLQMRGLKRNTRNNPFVLNGSHLLQMRGLKPCKKNHGTDSTRSHLLQMRGLKLVAQLKFC